VLIRPPIITEDDLGPAGWRALLGEAKRRGRKPRDQVLPLLRFATSRLLAGDNVELSRDDLEALEFATVA